MKNKFLLLISLVFILSVLGCAKQQKSVQTEPKTEANLQQAVDSEIKADSPIREKLSDFRNVTNDLFVGTIISVEEIDGVVDFPNVTCNENIHLNLCTLNVEKVYKSQFVTEGTTIKIINGWQEKDEQGRYIIPFENGKKYIMSGTAQPYENKPVMVVLGDLSCHIDDVGNITPITTRSMTIYKGISTVDELENDTEFKVLCEPDLTPWIPSVFYDKNDAKADREAVIEDIKTALKTDSELKTVKVEFDNFPDKAEK